MGCITFAVGVSAVACLALGYLSVFGRNGMFRFRCACSYIIAQTVAAILALCERTEFMRLIDAGIIWLAMAPVLTMWLMVLKKHNDRKKAQKNAEILTRLAKTNGLDAKILASVEK